MPETAVLEKPTSEAANFAEHKALRAPKKEPTTQVDNKPLEQTAPPATQQAQPEDKTQTAAESETADKSTQDASKPKRDRSLDGRIKELVAAGKHEEALKIWDQAQTRREKERADRLEQELQQYRTRKPEDSQPKSDQPKETAAPKTDDKATAPKLASFVQDPKYKTYEEAHEAWIDARDAWRDEQNQARTRQAEQERQRNSAKDTVNTRVTEARSKYADFDEVTKNVGIGYNPEGLLQFVQKFKAPMDVLYHLGQNPEEHQRILAIADPMVRWGELALIEHRLLNSSAPENKTTTAVPRKAPPPPRTFGGTEASTPKSTSEARSFAEHKRLRASGAA